MLLTCLNWLDDWSIEHSVGRFLLLHNVLLKACLMFLFFSPYIIQLRAELQNANKPQYISANTVCWFSLIMNVFNITTMQYGPQHSTNTPNTNIKSLVFSTDVLTVRVEYLRMFPELFIWLLRKANVVTTTLIKRQMHIQIVVT